MINLYSLKILINGIDRTSRVLWRTFNVTDEIDDTPNICNFEVLTYGSQTYKPNIGDSVAVSFNGSLYFSGKIINAENSGSQTLQTIKIKAKDNTILLDKILITARYRDLTIAQIIEAIISDTRFEGQITATNVSADVLVKTITFNAIPASKCIQKLAQQINYNWYIDEQNDIHFFAKNSEIAPFSLTDADPNYIEGTFKYKEDISQLKNAITVRGGDKISETTRTTTAKGDGTTTTFLTGYKFFELPVVKLNGVDQGVGIEYLDEDTNPAFSCFWSYNERKIRFKVAPLNTDTISMIGYPMIPILINVEDANSVSNYGRYEFKVDNKSIRSDDEAQQYALAQLDAYANSLVDFEFSTYTIGLRSGQTISVNSRGVSDSFIIQSIDMEILVVSFGALENLQDVNLENIQNNLSEDLIVNAGNSGALVFPMFKVRCASTKILGMVYFLQKLLLKESDNLEVDENQLLEVLNLDKQSVIISEEIVNDPFGGGLSPLWCLAPYFPSNPYTDRKRTTRNINGSIRINIT